MKILIADDHPLFREGLRRVISLEDDITLVAEAKDGEEAVKLALALRPDVIVLDITMPKLNGIEATRAILKEWPEALIVVLTFHSSEEYIMQVLQAGAKGYLVKDSDPASLAETIRLVYNGGSIYPPSILAKALSQAQKAKAETAAHKEPGAKLTPRELEILQCLAEGKSNREIADDLCISEKTVKNHLSNLFRKLDVSDRTQAVLYGLKHKLVDLS
ncbi:MAG: response regulator transcription factor [Firmicutes bacterium]|nr:response regulator transcription factor [Bacillota bacterium]